jgi:hypothetical protein
MLKQKPGRRTLFRVAIALLAPLLMTIVVANGTANAAWRNGAMFNLATAQCLDGGNNFLSVYPCNGTAAQVWHDIQSTSSPYYQLEDGLNQCTDGGQGNGLFGCIINDNYQEYSKEYVGVADGRTYYRFHWARDYSKCLDGGQDSQAMWFPCINSDSYQYWSWN